MDTLQLQFRNGLHELLLGIEPEHQAVVFLVEQPMQIVLKLGYVYGVLFTCFLSYARYKPIREVIAIGFHTLQQGHYLLDHIILLGSQK